MGADVLIGPGENTVWEPRVDISTKDPTHLYTLSQLYTHREACKATLK